MIRLRGHHLICLHFFTAEGYNPEFVENLREVLRRTAYEEIEIVSGDDDICHKCPYLKDCKCFYTEDSEVEIRAMDEKALIILGLCNGSLIRWEEIKKLLPALISQWRFDYCKSCDWKGVCESVDDFK